MGGGQVGGAKLLYFRLESRKSGKAKHSWQRPLFQVTKTRSPGSQNELERKILVNR